MNLFIFGGGGQVGTAFLRAAKRQGHTIVAPTRETVDIGDRDTVIRAVEDVRLDVVLNAAAYTHVDKAESEVELAFRINRDGAINVAVASATTGCPLVHLSTDYVFDGTNPAPYTTDDRPNPLSVYGKSKLEGEAGVHRHQPRHIILRTSWVFSAWRQNFVLTIRRIAATGRSPIRVVADQHGGPTSATAIASCIISLLPQILEEDFSAWGIYHYAGTPSTTWHGFAEAILADQPDCKVEAIPTSEYPTPAKRPSNAVLDCSRLTGTFGINQPNWRNDLEAVLAEIA